MKKVGKILAVAMAAAMTAGMAVMPASATILTDQTVTKISNPDNGQRETDGLVPEGDRETSYAWCIAARGDYVYIGTNKNIVGSTVESIMSSLEAAGITKDEAWKLANVLMNGDIPRPTTTEGGQIIRVNCLTNEIEAIYTAPQGTSFRMAITHGDNIYFGSYSVGADASFSTDTEEGLSNDIFCIDADDNVTKVFSSFNGTSMRAACEFEEKLYFGGVDADLELPEGWEGAAKLAILQMDEEDNTKWSRVADFEDFGMGYATNPALTSAAASPVWDICAYNGDIYATIPNGLGFAAFRGHPAKQGETANKYGWVWEEIVGFNNPYDNPIGLNPDASVATAGQISVVATPVVFNDELYLFDFDHTIGSVTNAVSGVMKQMLGQDVKASDYLRAMYNTLKHTQSLWKLNNETGQFEKVEAFSEMLENSTNEYVWRAEEYNGYLYLTTMDSAVLYNGITRLTNGSFVDMTADELKDQIKYIAEFAASLDPNISEAVAAAKEKLMAAVAELEALYAQLAENEDVQQFIAVYTAALIKIQECVNTIKEELAQNAFVQQIAAMLAGVKGMTQAKLAAVKAKIREFVVTYDLAALITGEPGATLYDMSEDDLEAYIEVLQQKLGEFVESLKVNVPELRPIDVEAIKAAAAEMFANLIDKTIGVERYEAILNLKEAFKNRVDYQKETLKASIAEKIGQAYAKLPDATKEKVEAFVQKYVVAAYDKIKAEYEAQVQKIQALKETLAAISQMTFGDYKALLDQAMDTAAANTLEAIDALDAELNKYGLTFTEEARAEAEAFIAEKTEENKAKIAEFFGKIAPDLDVTPAQAAKDAVVQAYNDLIEAANIVYYKAKEVYDSIDWEGVKMYAYISDCVQNDTWGFDMLRTADGENFEFVTVDGFGDKYNYGGRCMVATEYGLYVGTANPFYGAQLFRVKDRFDVDVALESDTITLGEQAVVNVKCTVGKCTVGPGNYRYSVAYKKENSTFWKVAAKDTTESSVSFTPASPVTYDVLVTAKGNDGTVIKTRCKLNVTSELINKSRLGADTITLGEKVKVRCKAVGGEGEYQYKILYKEADRETWYTLRDFDTKDVAVMKPATATVYDVMVIAKDAAGTEKEVVLSLTVNPVEETPEETPDETLD